MNPWQRILTTCALLAGLLVACGGTTSNDRPAQDQVNVPQSGSPTTEIGSETAPALATSRAGVATAVTQQEAATAQATASP